MSSVSPIRNKIIPLEVANVIISKYDSNLNLLEEIDQIYGKALDGPGTVNFKNGNTYKGNFQNGMLSGEGEFTFGNGIVYKGNFVDNKMTGKGRYQWPDGSYYEGDVNGGLRHGIGKHATAGEQCVYEGEWVDGMKHGKGTMRFKSGDVYEGEFVKGFRQGFGRFTYNSGNYYEGAWVLDKKEGKGTMNWVTKNEKYYGDWHNNARNGWGVHIWLEPRIDGKFLRNRYEGEWRDGMRHGNGVFYYSNGSKYEGEWAKDLKEGFAIFTYDDGRVVKGIFKNDKMVGNPDTILGDTETSRGAVLDESVRRVPGATSTGTSMNLGSTKKTGTVAITRENDVEVNPYNTMVDFSDLIYEDDDEEGQKEAQEVRKLLLRQHNNMKAWYRLYTSKQVTNTEESFGLTTKTFWKMLRDTKVLSPKAPIAALNRLCAQGSKNKFSLHTTQAVLKRMIFLAKSEFYETLTQDEKEQSGLQLKPLTNEELFTNDQVLDIHDENNTVLFRHFVDALVRLAYLKYGGAPNFSKKVEKILKKIQSGLEVRKKTKVQLEEENMLVKIRGLIEPLKEGLKGFFKRFPAKNQSFLFETVDSTMTVSRLLQIFEKTGIIADTEDRFNVLRAVERAYDNEDSYTKQTTNSNDSNLLRNMDILGELLISEITFLEFYDVFIFGLFSKDLLTIGDDEVKRRAANAVTKLKEYVQVDEEEAEDTAEREAQISWPYSDKDYMFDNLVYEKEKRERELAILRQKKLEREQEEKEHKLMEKEDVDISDEMIRPVTTESAGDGAEYVESQNDF